MKSVLFAALVTTMMTGAQAATQKGSFKNLPMKATGTTTETQDVGVSTGSLQTEKKFGIPSGTRTSLEMAIGSTEADVNGRRESHEFTLLTPEIGYKVKEETELTFQLPMAWDNWANTTGGQSSERAIGRPQVAVEQTLQANEEQKLAAHASVRLPFYETSNASNVSMISSEYSRVWGFEVGGDIERRVPQTAIHLLGGTGIEFNTSRTENIFDDGTAQLTITRHPILRMNAGAKYTVDRLAIGGMINTAFGLGRGHARVWQRDLNREDNLDLETTENWQLEIFGETIVGADAKVRASLAQSLKDVSSKRGTAAFQAVNAKDGAETLGSVSYAQTF